MDIDKKHLSKEPPQKQAKIKLDKLEQTEVSLGKNATLLETLKDTVAHTLPELQKGIKDILGQLPIKNDTPPKPSANASKQSTEDSAAEKQDRHTSK